MVPTGAIVDSLRLFFVHFILYKVHNILSCVSYILL